VGLVLQTAAATLPLELLAVFLAAAVAVAPVVI